MKRREREEERGDEGKRGGKGGGAGGKTDASELPELYPSCERRQSWAGSPRVGQDRSVKRAGVMNEGGSRERGGDRKGTGDGLGWAGIGKEDGERARRRRRNREEHSRSGCGIMHHDKRVHPFRLRRLDSIIRGFI